MDLVAANEGSRGTSGVRTWDLVGLTFVDFDSRILRRFLLTAQVEPPVNQLHLDSERLRVKARTREVSPPGQTPASGRTDSNV
jgi:hypothetical protein